jgi:hypothetical protein
MTSIPTTSQNLKVLGTGTWYDFTSGSLPETSRRVLSLSDRAFQTFPAQSIAGSDRGVIVAHFLSKFSRRVGRRGRFHGLFAVSIIQLV